MSQLLKWCFYLLLMIAPCSSCRALIVGSYNIRYANDGDVAKGNGWAQRAPVVAKIIQFHDFDVIGTQEVLRNQIADLENLLPEYGRCGVGRNDGREKGEYAAIFYKKSKLTVLNSGTFWLSATPGIPSIGWDADHPRICTWAKFKPVDGSEPFFAFNTHLDQKGKVARIQSVQLILSAIKNIAGGQRSFVTGDFNFDQSSEGYKNLLAPGILFDSFISVTDRYALTGTTNGFNINSRSESRIDHILHTSDFKPRRYGILTDSYRAAVVADKVGTEQPASFPADEKMKEYQARLPSDHFPVLVEF
jgi:endonuclease/exonuclease/phosphatase family metal-dependent hydrolase